MTRSMLGEQEEPRTSTLEIDRAGRLVGGSYDYIFGTLVSGTTNYDIRYDSEGKRTSSLNAVVSATTHFEYNTAGQISSAVEIDQFGKELFPYEFGYSPNGNHVSNLSYTLFGVLFSTDVYTYEASADAIFNHGYHEAEDRALRGYEHNVCAVTFYGPC